jgi:hypothetical protein
MTLVIVHSSAEKLPNLFLENPLHHIFLRERDRVRGHQRSDPHPSLSQRARVRTLKALEIRVLCS